MLQHEISFSTFPPSIPSLNPSLPPSRTLLDSPTFSPSHPLSLSPFSHSPLSLSMFARALFLQLSPPTNPSCVQSPSTANFNTSETNAKFRQPKNLAICKAFSLFNVLSTVLELPHNPLLLAEQTLPPTSSTVPCPVPSSLASHLPLSSPHSHGTPRPISNPL